MARDVTESAVPFTFTRNEPIDWTSALVFETSVPDDNGSKAPRAFSGLVVARRLGPPPDWRHFGFEGTASRTIRRLGGQPEHAWRLRPFHPEVTWLDAIVVLYGLTGGLHLLILNSTTQRGTTLTPPSESD